MTVRNTLLWSPGRVAAAFLCVAATATAAPRIAFPNALAAANVRMADIHPNDTLENLRTGLVVGNGEVNAILYVAGPSLMLRVAKNDVWDGRIDTSEDPALPKVDPATHQLFREKPGNPPSWNKPYPCAVPTADIKLAGLDRDTSWEMALNLQQAVATVKTPAESTVIRALGQGNVFSVIPPRRGDWNYE
jgi:hypothetical protein